MPGALIAAYYLYPLAFPCVEVQRLRPDQAAYVFPAEILKAYLARLVEQT